MPIKGGNHEAATGSYSLFISKLTAPISSRLLLASPEHWFPGGVAVFEGATPTQV